MAEDARDVMERFRSGLIDRGEALRLLSGRQQGVGQPERIEEDSRSASGSTVEKAGVDFFSEIRLLVADQLKVPADELDPSAQLDEYGMDSITINELAQRMEERWQIEIAPADLVEHTTLEDLASYFTETYGGKNLAVSVPPQDDVTASPSRRVELQRPLVNQVSVDSSETSEACYAPIAIVGMSGRFPGGETLDEFWSFLMEGGDAIRPYPAERREWWGDYRDFVAQTLEGKEIQAGLLDRIDTFDSLFFNISPREAEFMDPQHRMLMETVWHTVEDAGYRTSELAGRPIGLFAGICGTDYLQLAVRGAATVEGPQATGASPSIGTNRISYFMDWTGPSEPVDTACSSSLVAVHRAIKAIHDEECEMAVAGGVAALAGPVTFGAFEKAGMMAPDSRCRTFDADANGYVRAEGVGAVLLKPLAKALEDGDSIHGVIRGTAVNHGGRGRSLTVPKSDAQAQCLAKALSVAQVAPSQISYVEAHGTGTSVGDPQEVAGLVAAFGNAGVGGATPWCGLGSVKTNIGHLEGAAGIVGLVKVLLAMRHGELPALVHFRRPNPSLPLEGAPFYLVKEAKEWPRAKDASGELQPRRAVVNSFGYGGVNACAIVEEAPTLAMPDSDSGPVLLVWSAKTAAQLRETVARGCQWLDRHPLVDLRRIGFTLCAGREGFRHRLALVVETHKEAVEKLTKWLGDDQESEECFWVGQGRANSEQELAAVRPDDRPSRAVLREKAQAWIAGDDFSPHEGGVLPRGSRVSVPGYAFAKRSHWLPRKVKADGVPLRTDEAHRKPGQLVSFEVVEAGLPGSVRAKISRSAFFVRDHVIMGKALLPGVAYLELGRLAFETLGQRSFRRGEFRISQVAWLRPMVFDEPELLIQVRFESGAQAESFKGFVEAIDSEGSVTLHGQFRVVSELDGGSSVPDAVSLDSMKPNAKSVLDSSAVYQAFREGQHDYGNSFQCLRRVWVQDDWALGRLERQESDPYPDVIPGLHPPLLDAALQTASALVVHGEGGARSMALPFAVGTVRQRGSCDRVAFALVRRQKRTSEKAKTESYQVNLLDEAGHPIIVLDDFRLRAVKVPDSEATSSKPVKETRPTTIEPSLAESPSIDRFMWAAPVWREDTVERTVRNGRSGQDPILVFETEERALPEEFGQELGWRSLIRVHPGDRFQHLDDSRFAIKPENEADYQALFSQLSDEGRTPATVIHLWSLGAEEVGDFGVARSMALTLESAVFAARALTKKGTTSLDYFCLYRDGDFLAGSLPGFFRSLAQELKRLAPRTVALDEVRTWCDALRKEWQIAPSAWSNPTQPPTDIEVRYSSGKRMLRGVQQVHPVPHEPLPVQRGGAYLISGGLGGIGRLVADWLVTQVSAKVVLMGRSRLSDESHEFIERLQAIGGKILYVQGDTASFSDCRRAVVTATREFGRLDGIFHAAGALRDGAFLRKSPEDFDLVVRGKLVGAWNLDRASRELALECFVMFGSVSGLIGNRGQTDYAAANRGLTEFAKSRNLMRAQGKRSGCALTIDWPLWASGGMSLDPKVATQMAALTGMEPLPSVAGLEALQWAMRSEESSLAAFYGDTAKIGSVMGIEAVEKPAEVPRANALAGEAGASKRASDRQEPSGGTDLLPELTRLVAETLKVSSEELDPDESLDQLGVDSIIAMDVMNKLEGALNVVLDPSVIVDYSTLSQLSTYLKSQMSDSNASVDSGRQGQLVPTGSPSSERGRDDGDVLERVTRLIAGELKISSDELDPDAALDEYGVDSIVAMRLLEIVEQEFGVVLDPGVIVDHGSLGALAKFLSKEMGVVATGLATGPAASSRTRSRIEVVSAEKPRVRADEPVAVIGMSGKFAQSPNLEAYWNNLIQGRNLIGQVPSSRWSLDEYFDPDPTVPQKSYSRWAAYLDRPEDFDPEFFKMSESEARMIDPQHRLVMECGQWLLDDAGYVAEELRGENLGVYLGVGEMGRFGESAASEEDLGRLVVNSSPNMAPARLSQIFDWRGPALAIDTACSSSLVALHEACESLKNGTCRIAIGGGVQLLGNNPVSHVVFSKAGVLAKDGIARVFDRESSGFILGEGIGMLMLKRLSDAVADGDSIAAVILGSAINNDGRTMGLTTPNQEAQMEVLRAAYERAGVKPDSIGYLEAHGTGTLLGDPIEIRAATRLFREFTEEKQFCGVGSVKSNLGHLLRAAGSAGVLKLMLALKHQMIPPTLNCDEPHPRFEFESSAFYPVKRAQAWKPKGGHLRGGVSSFGFGGTNCHMVIESAETFLPDYKASRVSRPLTSFQHRTLSRSAETAQHEEVSAGSLSPKTKSRGSEKSYVGGSASDSTVAGAAKNTDLGRLIANYLRGELANLLEAPAESVDIDANFMELGLDSVNVIGLSERLETELKVELYPTLLFEHTTIKELSDYFAEEFSDAFSNHLGLVAETKSRPEPVVQREVLPTNLEPQDPRENQRHENDYFGSGATGSRDIAVVGMSGRFPEADNYETFWERLIQGADLMREIPSERFDFQSLFDPERRRPDGIYCKWGSFLSGVDQFDAGFFDISPPEASLMDPQLRMLLETFYQSVEDAGMASQIRGSKTGVYVGVCFHDYSMEMARSGKEIDPYDGTGNAATMLANRLSYLFDLQGPSLPVDTACSSSLVALHLACQALRQGECDSAFVGGANLMLTPAHYQYFCRIGALSPTGRCHSFDEAADGYTPGEAVVGLMLKPLDAARRDGDAIHGIIRGTAVNHGGQTASVTAPNPQRQADVIKSAWQDGRIDPRQLSYLEAHGTGTKLGDPVEIQGMRQAFEQVGARPSRCYVGSAKAHLGHTEGAAGLVGVVKTLLSMRHRRLPGMPGFHRVNPLIKLKDSPLRLLDQSVPWESQGTLLAGVSSFGFGGTYAHVVLESGPVAIENQTPGPSAHSSRVPILLSARNQQGLRILAGNLSQYLGAQPDSTPLEPLSWALARKEAFQHRAVFLAGESSSLITSLRQFSASEKVGDDVFSGSIEGEEALELGATEEDRRFLQGMAERGDWRRLAQFWCHGAQVEWGRYIGPSVGQQREHLPTPATYPFQRSRYWFSKKTAVSDLVFEREQVSQSGPVEEHAQSSESSTRSVEESGRAAQRGAELGAFLRTRISSLLDCSENELEVDVEFDRLGLDSIAGMNLIQGLQDQFGIQVYANELVDHPTLRRLETYLQTRLKNSEPVVESRASSRSEQSDPVFLLSSPRAGSTLLRVMLAGHPQLFSPPELHLLGFEDSRSRAEALSGRRAFLGEGLPKAMMSLQQCDVESAKQWWETCVSDNRSSLAVYQELCAAAGDKLLIDKSPSYAESDATLSRALEWFPKSRFIVLVRHPLAVMESLVRNRFDQLLGAADSDPWTFAESVWREMYGRLLNFRERVESSRLLTVPYEELVSDPEGWGRRVCEFLGVPFDPAVLAPYDGERMIEGLYKDSMGIGDPNFGKHSAIDSDLAEAWREHLPSDLRLNQKTIAVAERYGYAIEAKWSRAATLPCSISSCDWATSGYAPIGMSFEESPWSLCHWVRLKSAETLDLTRLELAWETMGRRYPLLGAVLIDGLEGTNLGQGETRLLTLEPDGQSGNARKRMIQQELLKMHTELDIRKGPTSLVKLMPVSERQVDLLWVASHWLSDGFSSGLVLNSWVRTYRGEHLPSKGVDFVDYRRQVVSLWQQANQNEILAFWQEHLGDKTELPDAKEKNTGTYADERELTIKIPLVGPASFEQVARALYEALQEWTGECRPAVVHRISGRRIKSMKIFDCYGNFALDVPLRWDHTDQKPLLEGLPFGGISYALLHREQRLPHPNEISSVRLNYQPRPIIDINTGGLRVEARAVFPVRDADAKREYDLDLIVRTESSGLRLIARYSKRQFSATYVRRLVSEWIDRIA